MKKKMKRVLMHGRCARITILNVSLCEIDTRETVLLLVQTELFSDN